MLTVKFDLSGRLVVLIDFEASSSRYETLSAANSTGFSDEGAGYGRIRGLNFSVLWGFGALRTLRLRLPKESCSLYTPVKGR